jgi:hypothetical protein
MTAVSLTMMPAAGLWPAAPGEDRPGPRPAAATSRRPQAAFGGAGTAKALLRALQVGGLSAATVETARRGLHKMAAASARLASADSLESGLAAVLAEQTRQSNQRSDLARSEVLRRLEQLKARNQAELEEIDKRVEAARNAGFWSTLVNIFKAIGAALSAASSIFTGPAGMVAAGLLVASIVVSLVKPDGWGQWLSLGLSLAAMALGGYAAISNLVGASASGASSAAAEALKGGIELATELGSVASQAAAAGATFAKGHYTRKELLAQAALTELRALKQQLLAEANQEREEMKAVIEAQNRGVKVVLRALASHQRAVLEALRRSP